MRRYRSRSVTTARWERARPPSSPSAPRIAVHRSLKERRAIGQLKSALSREHSTAWSRREGIARTDVPVCLIVPSEKAQATSIAGQTE